MKVRFEFYSSRVPVGNDRYPDKYHEYTSLTRAIQGMCRHIEALESKGCTVIMCRAYIVGDDIPFEILYPHSFETWDLTRTEQKRGEQE